MSWLAGQRITAERLRAEQGVWQDYTPSWVATTTNPSVGNGLRTGRYMQVGTTLDFMIRIVWGSTTNSGSGAYDFGLPVLPRTYGGGSNIAAVADCVIEIGSPSRRYGLGVLVYSTGLVRIADNGVSGSGIGGGGHGGHSWGAGNFLLLSGRYEVAA